MFTDADREAIRKAVHDAEGHTAGEIVPFVTRRSGRYAAAAWRAGALLGLVGTVLAWTTQQYLGTWGAGWLHSATFPHLTGLVFAAVGFVCGRYWAPCTRWFTGKGTMERSAHRRAMEAFVEEEVFNTRDRTGILLFVSLMERRIEVVGDSGINRNVSPDDWVEVVSLALNGIRSGKAADGLVAAIAKCGALLREKGVAIQADDTNELSDSLRLDAGD